MSEPSACLNCNEPFGAQRPRYCPACGQESNLKPPTLREFAQQFGGSYLAIEGALWRSLKLLLLRPGELTREYLLGRRRRYVLPLRLYLTISVIVLLGLRLMGSVELRAIDDPGHPVANEPITLSMFGGRAGSKDGAFYCERLPQWLCARLKKRLDVDPQSLVNEIAAFGQRFLSNIGAAMFLAVPAFAAGLKLLYLGRAMRYTEHLVFALHLHAFWFLMLGLSLPGLSVLSALAFLAVPVYSVLALRRVYRGRWWLLLLRSAALAAGYVVVLGIALGALAVWTLLF